MKLIEFETDLDKSGNERLRVKLSVEKGEVKDVVYQYESFVNDEWIPIVRYDVAHGFFHRDELFADGRKDKIEVTIEDLKSASKYAEQDLKDRWEWYKERYFKKKKKNK